MAVSLGAGRLARIVAHTPSVDVHVQSRSSGRVEVKENEEEVKEEEEEEEKAE